MKVIVWYLVAIIVDIDGVSHSEVMSEHHLLEECFEEREVVLWTAELSDPIERMEAGLQLVCMGRNKETT